MLEKWLEKEAQAKTASQQFEEELTALEATPVARSWDAKHKEAEDSGEKRYRGAILGGAALGGVAGTAAGAADAYLRHARGVRGPLAALGSGVGLLGGAARGALGGHIMESDWGEKHPVGRIAVPLLVSGPAGTGGAAIGARLAGGKRKNTKRKTSSMNNLKCAAARVAEVK